MGEEFEPTVPSMGGISEEQRLEASARKVVITPVHNDIFAEDLPDEVIATQHLVQPAIGNIPIDSELTTASPAQQRIDKKNHRFALTVSLVTVAVVSGVSIAAYLAVANRS